MIHGLTESLDDVLLTRLLAELGVEAASHRFRAAPNPCVGAAILAGGAVAEAVLRSPRINPQSVDASVVRISARVLRYSRRS